MTVTPSEPVRLTLPFPPSINGLYGGGSNQKRFPSKQYKKWIAACPSLPALMLSGVAITYEYHFPDARERDTENYVKAVTDYLVNHRVLKNDDWKNVLSMLLLPIGIDRINPRVEILIYSSEYPKFSS